MVCSPPQKLAFLYVENKPLKVQSTEKYKTLFPSIENMKTGVVRLTDWFDHDGPNGCHICMVFEPMGPNVLSVIKKYQFKGVPLEIVRKIAYILSFEIHLAMNSGCF